MSIIDEINAEVVAGHPKAVERLVAQALAQGTAADPILRAGLIPAMAVVGERFERGETFVPEMMVSAKAMKAGLALLKPHLQAGQAHTSGKVVIGTVQGDLHDIGKNLVAILLEGAGFEVIDLGTSVTPAQFVEAVRQHQAHLVGLSALLTTTMAAMKTTIEALDAAGLRPATQVIIGGAPVTAEFAALIGADLFAPDASAATHLARRVMAERAAA